MRETTVKLLTTYKKAHMVSAVFEKQRVNSCKIVERRLRTARMKMSSAHARIVQLNPINGSKFSNIRGNTMPPIDPPVDASNQLYAIVSR